MKAFLYLDNLTKKKNSTPIGYNPIQSSPQFKRKMMEFE